MNEEQKPLAVDSLKSETNAGVENSQEQTGLSESGEDTGVKDTQEQNAETKERGERSEAESAVRFVGYFFGIPAAIIAVLYGLDEAGILKFLLFFFAALPSILLGLLSVAWWLLGAVFTIWFAWKIFRYTDKHK